MTFSTTFACPPGEPVELLLIVLELFVVVGCGECFREVDAIEDRELLGLRYRGFGLRGVLAGVLLLRGREAFAHQWNVRGQPGAIGDHRDVDIADAQAGSGQLGHHPSQQAAAIGAAPIRVGVWEVLAYVAK